MKIHQAHIESVEDLGPNGIAFTIICCHDPATAHRHTVQHAHTMSDDELRSLLTRYVKNHSRLHQATTHNHERVKEMIAEGGICGVCSAK